MNIGKRIADFLQKNRGTFYCDDCLQSELKLARRQEAQPATAALSGAIGYERKKINCPHCGREKLSIRAL